MRILLKDLIPGEDYALQLRANTGSVASEWSRIFNFTAATDIVAPDVVTDLTWAVIGSSFVATWTGPTKNNDGTDLTDFKDYEVEVENGSVAAFFYTTEEKFVFDIDKNRAVFDGPKGTVKITVKARDLNYNVVTNGATLTYLDPPPQAPQNVLTQKVVNGIQISWDPVEETDLKFYRVYMGTTPDVLTTKVWEGLSSTYTYSTIDFASTFYFRITSVDQFDQESGSNTDGDQALPFDPTDSTPPVNPVWSTDWFTSETDLSDKFIRKVNVTLKWNPNPEDDIGRYVVRYRKDSVGDWTTVEVVGTYLVPPLTTLKILGLTADATYQFQLAAQDKTGNTSDWTVSPAPGTTGKDNTAPSAPSAPQATNYIGGLIVAWDGKTSTGASMPADFSHVELHTSTTSGFTPSASTLKTRMNDTSSRTQSVYVGGLPYDTVVYIKLIAVDYSGNSSPASAQSSATPKKVTGVDIGPNSIVAGSAIIGEAAIDSAQIGNLEVGKLTTGEISTGQRIIAGPVEGTHAEMTSSGFRVYKEDTNGDGAPEEVVRLGVAETNDFFAISKNDGTLAASIDETGQGNFDALRTNQDIYIAADPINGFLADYLKKVGGRPVGWTGTDIQPGWWTATNTEVGYLNIIVEVPPSSNGSRTQLIVMEGPQMSAATGDCCFLRIRRGAPGFTQDTAEVATVASSILRQKIVYPIRPTFSQATSWVMYHYQDAHPTRTTYVNYLLSYATANGSTGVQGYRADEMEWAVIDLGESYPRSGGMTNGGGGGVPPTPPQPPTQQYTFDVACNGFQSIRGNGSLRSDTNGEVVQGYYDSTNGNGYGYLFFPNIAAQLTGAISVDAVFVYLYSSHWYSNAGGTALVGFHNGVGNRTGVLTTMHMSKPGSAWINLTNLGTMNAWAGPSPGYQGITLGPGLSTSSEYYGRFPAVNAVMRFYYTK